MKNWLLLPILVAEMYENETLLKYFQGHRQPMTRNLGNRKIWKKTKIATKKWRENMPGNRSSYLSIVSYNILLTIYLLPKQSYYDYSYKNWHGEGYLKSFFKRTSLLYRIPKALKHPKGFRNQIACFTLSHVLILCY